MNPGFWEKVFLGRDINGNGMLEPGEKGILPSFIDWIGSAGMFFVNGPLDSIVGLLPNTEVAEFAETIKGAIHFINQWVPVDVMLTSLIFYWAAYFILTTGHLIWKAIPLTG